LAPYIDPWYHNALSEPVIVSFESITYDGSGMRISLRDENNRERCISLYFSDLPTAVRIANESQRLRSLRHLPKNRCHSFYRVANSEFIAWLNTESLDIYKNDPLFHLAIVTDEWIDLICNDLPEITITTSTMEPT
jgi:hypothetical protein